MNYFTVLFENHSSFDLSSHEEVLKNIYADMCFDLCMASRVSTLKIILRDGCPDLAGKVKMDIDIEEVCILCNVFWDERCYKQWLRCDNKSNII